MASSAVTRSLRQLFLTKAVERGLGIDLRSLPGMPQMLHYDPVRVRQCVGNLIVQRHQVHRARQCEDGGVFRRGDAGRSGVSASRSATPALA
jgi:hypothetical protein